MTTSLLEWTGYGRREEGGRVAGYCEGGEAKADFDRKSAFFIDNFLDKTLDKTPDKIQSRMRIIYKISDSSGCYLFGQN